jgi:chemotaxis protein CheD
MITVGVGDMQLTNRPDEVLVTYALGSCAGLAIFDPEAQVGGLLHCMLPLSQIDKAKAEANPYMFVDTGVPELFTEAYRLGAQKNRLKVKVAGCAQILDAQGHFRIGERNYATLRKILWKNNVLIDSEDVGGSISRTLYFEIASGRVSIRSNGQVKEL